MAFAQVAALGLNFTTSETAVGPEAGGACAIVRDRAERLRDRASGGRELKYTLQIGHDHQQGGHQVLDLPADTMPQKLDIAVDHLGTCHLVYIRADGRLRYARREALDSSWLSLTLDEKADCSI